MYIYVIFQTQRVPVDRLCAIFPQQRRENRHPRLCSHVAGQLYHLNYIVNQLYHDIFIILSEYIIIIIIIDYYMNCHLRLCFHIAGEVMIDLSVNIRN